MNLLAFEISAVVILFLRQGKIGQYGRSIRNIGVNGISKHQLQRAFCRKAQHHGFVKMPVVGHILVTPGKFRAIEQYGTT